MFENWHTVFSPYANPSIDQLVDTISSSFDPAGAQTQLVLSLLLASDGLRNERDSAFSSLSEK